MLNEKYIKVLYIDLDTEKVRIERRHDLVSYLGGVGIASKLLLENLRPELEPSAPEQPIVFAIGSGAYIFPVLSKTVAMFVSPLTGELGESYAGGRLAMSMLMAGYDALVITGKSKRHSYLTVSSENVNIRDARAMWGLPLTESVRNIRDREHSDGRSAGKRSILCIGPGGENCVDYACVAVDVYRHFGRMGLGACMGGKNLKAIMVYGNRSIPILDQKAYFKAYQNIYKKCTTSGLMAKYHDLGTPVNILPLNKSGGLPTLNLQSGTFEHADAVSGEAFAQKNLVRKLSCSGCPVGCIHIGMYRREFDKGHEYEAISVAYDYELIFALGSFLGVKETDEILAIIEEVEEYGLDAMSVGVCLGWATEALERGLVTIDDTLTDLKFGNAEGYIQAIRYISKRKNEFYHALGKGCRYASGKYGGEDFAMQFAGNEMPGYHTGYGSVVGPAVGARHSHLCNGGYSLDQSMKEFDEDVMVEKLFLEECERCMTNSLVMCLFARKIYDRETILEALRSIGWSITDEDLTEIGKRIYQTKLQIKEALGFKQTEVKLPKRFFETPSMNGVLDEETAYRMIRKYVEKTDALMQESYD
ncbi:MAG: aldehyde:ferredoxin oxidoreductase [Oscillospiraceae bacterium]|nr:aldehyde:ferredoxin oxidoreductase [Oscillospiraceae bacterium]